MQPTENVYRKVSYTQITKIMYLNWKCIVVDSYAIVTIPNREAMR